MKTYIVTWWDGEEIVRAENMESAKELVVRMSAAYRNGGRGAPLFVEEFVG